MAVAPPGLSVTVPFPVADPTDRPRDPGPEGVEKIGAVQPPVRDGRVEGLPNEVELYVSAAGDAPVCVGEHVRPLAIRETDPVAAGARRPVVVARRGALSRQKGMRWQAHPREVILPIGHACILVRYVGVVGPVDSAIDRADATGKRKRHSYTPRLSWSARTAFQ